ncbi:Cytochrome c-type biogenesis protein DsbD, protein-disulfide reductase [Mariniradius saccharolyticus AK6]|uniref:Cytochrome c-type biogenesis protein DsbD, protein-disulfide reductase n=1 Tax=Mariniradius saccharolyticus AK6 TaxID=1239962 RepID=M7XJG7_9BACT|nr:cytochrome c biogenesis protein CcdA [Mariniradius saccharolyticus]EMS34703.1 Cytochrome c-type biogenesis protein DsbD, protein-disulfide reductase [Mariniradius saccharolyticus AK6]
MSRFLPLSLIALLLFFFQVQSFGQLVSPPKWTIQLAEKDLKVGQEAEIVLKASIPMNWYIYSNDFDENAGPVLTTLSLEGSKGISVKEKLSPINPKKKFDKVWEADITYFSGIGEFRQKITITEPNVEIKGVVEYQMCSDVTGQCILYEEDFTIKATAVSDEPAAANATTTQEPTVAPDSANRESTVAAQPTDADSASKENRTVVTLDPEEGKGGLIGFMFVAFLAGLAALLTPCVFPMIPMTVTFFTGRAKSRAVGIRNAFIYGLSIIAIYTIAGTAVAAIQGPEFANWLSTHWVPNVFFFLVFIVFAMAFLGMFELTLPSGFVNKIDAKSDKGGLTGVFFMAFTLVLVSFSCTGPIVGSILIKSAGGDFITPIAGMFAFSLAFAIPFTLFAIFPEWLNSLPKSGGWLNSVKVVLGFLELALAFKFLSIADQVYHWGILDRDIYLAIWIVIFGLLGFYLLGKIRLPHDSKMEHIGVPRLMLAIVTFVFVVYMIPGLWGAPLKALSGYLPPISSHDFNLLENRATGTSESNALDEVPKYADFLHFPHGIQGYFDYKQALAAAKKQGKPLFIDFTGHGCVNCREMEARVWSDPQVLQRLKNDFVMVALYIDERHPLPESEWYTSTYDGKVKSTIGKQNADFQITRFNNNAQPYYVILDHNEELLVKPKAYDTNIQNFVNFLEEAKAEFGRR